MPRRPRSLRVVEYLQHILDAAERIRRYTAGMNAEGFAQDLLVQDAVIRNLEVIGEASRNVLVHHPEFAAANHGYSVAKALRNAQRAVARLLQR